jgi:hypothetical protein
MLDGMDAFISPHYVVTNESTNRKAAWPEAVVCLPLPDMFNKTSECTETKKESNGKTTCWAPEISCTRKTMMRRIHPERLFLCIGRVFFVFSTLVLGRAAPKLTILATARRVTTHAKHLGSSCSIICMHACLPLDWQLPLNYYDHPKWET